MADSAVLTFTDPDAYHANIRRAQVVQGVVTTRGEYRSEGSSRWFRRPQW